MEKAPERLFVCKLKYDPAAGRKLAAYWQRGEPLPADLLAVREKHALQHQDLAKRGMLWAGGPSSDFTVALDIFSVSSLEEAKQAEHNDEFYKAGVWQHDDEWFEWTVHVPSDKVSPLLRQVLYKIDKGITHD